MTGNIKAMRDACDQLAALHGRVVALTTEIERLRAGLARIRADYPEAREAATAILWPMEGGAA